MPTETEIALYYASSGLSPRVVAELEEMRRESPCRQVAVGALTHTRVDFFSRQNSERRQFESDTCEHLFGLLLELSNTTFGYWNQVSIKGVRRGSKINSAVADFLVLDEDCIRVVECKPIRHLRRLAEKRPDEWQLTPAGWTRPAVAEWCRARGLMYQIWAPPEPFGVYLANTMALYDVGSRGKGRLPISLSKVLAKGPCTIAQAISEVGCSFDAIVGALIAKQIFGPVKSIPIDQVDRFLLFPDATRAERLDEDNLKTLLGDRGKPTITSPLLSASRADYRHAERRLARVRRMLEGTEPITRRYEKLVKAVARADSEGGVPLQECLTSFYRSGRRCAQLTQAQVDAIREVTARYIRGSQIRTKKQMHFELQSACEHRGCRTPSATTLLRHVAETHPQWRALNTGGKRAFHSLSDPVTPINRTVNAKLPFLKVHVDSSKFDNRLLNEVAGPSCPVLYVALDASNDIALARALVFGRACRDVLAILIRDMVFRHGRVPAYWVADQGCEYKNWFTSFCTHTGASRYHFPVGAPKHNSLAENAIKRVNTQVAHQLVGSTEPDRAGRSVDNKYKSYRTAKHAFVTALQQIDEYLFGDLPETASDIAIGSPRERYEDLVATVGLGGRQVKYDDDFKILTSIPLDRQLKISPGKGIRHEGRTYTCEVLFEALRRKNSPLEIRRDCVDPTVLYVKFASGWVTASSSDSLRLRTEPTESLLFESMTGQQRRTENRKNRDELARARYDKLKLINASASAVSHLVSVQVEKPPRLPKTDWSELSNAQIDPYPVKEP